MGTETLSKTVSKDLKWVHKIIFYGYCIIE